MSSWKLRFILLVHYVDTEMYSNGSTHLYLAYAMVYIYIYIYC